MARTVPEWIGKTDNAPIPTRVKLRILRRQEDRCAGIWSSGEQCTVVFDERHLPEFDHRPAIINGGQNRESMIFALCEACHDALYPGDMAEKSRTNAIKAKHLRLKGPKRPWPKRRDPWGKDWRARYPGVWERREE